MAYNINFLIAALVFLGLVMFHFSAGKKVEDSTEAKIFPLCIAVGLADIVMDLLTALLVATAESVPLGVLYGSYCLFFILQFTIPTLIFLRVLSLAKLLNLKNAFLLAFAALPYLLFVAIVASDPLTGLLFSFDPQTHAYIHGPFYYGVYAYALVSTLIALIVCMQHRRHMRTIDYYSIWEFALILAACVGIQAANPSLLVTGFGIALGLTVFYLTINNPFESIDPLTHVFEATSFKRRVRQLMESGKPFDLVFVSFNNLHTFNVIAGDASGDELLEKSALELLRASADQQVYRLKDARFVIIASSHRESRRITAETKRSFDHPILIKDLHLEVKASIACLQNAHELTEPDQITSYLDFLVDRISKQDSTILVEEGHSLESFHRYQSICTFLPTALSDGLFETHLQPLWEAETGRFSTAEALCRLKHPQLGYIPPNEFLGIAEEEGLISKITMQQIASLARFLTANEQELKRMGLKTVKVNLSPTELMDKGLSTKLIAAIRENGADPSQFHFEITENSALEYNDELMTFADTLLSNGSALLMDDFGTGYSNIKTVMQFPFAAIKLDRSLIMDIDADRRSARLCKAMIEVFSDLGLMTVAESVENAAQAKLVTEWGITYIQGFHFCRPLPFDSFLAFLRQNQD